jgi:sirohydrochlorin cobaltochelatase
VYEHAARLRASGRFAEVGTAFWKEEPSLSRGLDGLHSRDITVVPVFMADGYFAREVIPREMGLDGCLTRRAGRTIRYTSPVGVHPSLAGVIAQRAREAGATGDETLFVLGHGTPRNPRSERSTNEQAARVRESGAFAEVGAVFLDQEPHMSRVFELTERPGIVVVPLFIADGWHVEETIPRDLALDGRGLERDGRRLRYAAAVGTHPGVACVIAELASEAARW